MTVLLGVLLKAVALVQTKERAHGVCPMATPAATAATPSERIAAESASMHSATRPERRALGLLQICSRGTRNHVGADCGLIADSRPFFL